MNEKEGLAMANQRGTRKVHTKNKKEYTQEKENTRLQQENEFLKKRNAVLSHEKEELKKQNRNLEKNYKELEKNYNDLEKKYANDDDIYENKTFDNIIRIVGIMVLNIVMLIFLSMNWPSRENSSIHYAALYMVADIVNNSCFYFTRKKEYRGKMESFIWFLKALVAGIWIVSVWFALVDIAYLIAAVSIMIKPIKAFIQVIKIARPGKELVQSLKNVINYIVTRIL